MFCAKCGKPIPDASAFCPYCGTNLQPFMNPRQKTVCESQPVDSVSEAPAFEPVAEVPEATVVKPAAEVPEMYAETAPAIDSQGIAQNESQPDDMSLINNAAEVMPERYEQPAAEEASGVSTSKKGKKWVIFGAVGAVVVLGILLICLLSHNAKQKKYNDGVTCLEQGNYAEACEIFTQLKNFGDSEKMAAYAKSEMELQSVEDLLAAEDYAGVAAIFRARSYFLDELGDNEKVEALADETETLAVAFEEMADEDYVSAIDDFTGLILLKEDYEDIICLCRAYAAEQNQNWMEILVNLYALQIGDPQCNFLDNPVSEEDWMVSDGLNHIFLDPLTVADVVHTDNPITAALKETAVKGFRYDEARELLANEEYSSAMDIFAELGDFLDSKAFYEEAKEGYDSFEGTYQQAEEYYYSGEYFKAMELYLELGDYKDSAEKAEACPQRLPENGALKIGNGSALDLTIKVPDQYESVFLKLYDSTGTAVSQAFIRPGSSTTIGMSAGVYTIKAAYGTQWYGDIDLFGEDGDYQQLLNGSSEYFELESGYTYTLTLGGVDDGNVGTRGVGGASGM